MRRILLILLCIWLVGCSKISDLQLIYDEVADDLPLLMEVNEEIIEEVYDLEVDYNLIQATVNVMVKNNFEDNVLFAVDQNFSEDERFDTENLMKKKKIC